MFSLRVWEVYTVEGFGLGSSRFRLLFRDFHLAVVSLGCGLSSLDTDRR